MTRAKTRERISSQRSGKDGSNPGDDDLAPEDAEAGAALIGTVIDGRYELLELIGQGGMGSVFKAEHTGIRRTVALKLLHPSLARVPEVGRRFKREAVAIGRIEHPNCVNVSDFGALEDGSLYLVMEYLEGRSLGDVLAEVYRIEPRRTLHILRHVLRGLGHAHKQEIIHRDVKPENVLLIEHDDDPDFAKILDFGIAKLIGEAAKEASGGTLTQAGMAFGTPVYMSPEQAVGNPIDGRADLYAATVMAYEMITGHPPFNSEDKLEVMTMHTAKPPPPMRHYAPNLAIPADIEALLMRGLAKRPSDRYADASDYVTAIDAVLGDASAPHAVPAGSPTRTPSGPASAPDLQLGEDLPSVTRLSAPVPPLSGDVTRVDRSPVPPQITPTHPSGPVAATPHARTHAPHTDEPAFVSEPPPRYPTHDAAGKPLRPGTQSPVPGGPSPLTRKRVIAAIAGAAALGILVAVVAGGSGQKDSSLAEQAAKILEQGDPQGAIALLEEDAEKLAKDPAAQLELGHAHAAIRDNLEAVAAYRRALALDPKLDTRDKLRVNLETMLDDKKGKGVAAAFDLWTEVYRDEQSDTKLIELATTHKTNDVRDRAVEEIRERTLGDRVDWIAVLALDLEHRGTCEERKEVVAKLRATDDERAIPALRQAIRRKFPRRRRNKNNNRCLIKDAREAVQYLRNRHPDAGVDAAPE